MMLTPVSVRRLQRLKPDVWFGGVLESQHERSCSLHMCKMQCNKFKKTRVLEIALAFTVVYFCSAFIKNVLMLSYKYMYNVASHKNTCVHTLQPRNFSVCVCV